MDGLVTFLQPSRDEAFDGDPLREALDPFFKGEEKAEALLVVITDYCENFSINTAEDLTRYYRTLISLLFLRKFRQKRDERLDNRIRSLILNGRIKRFGKRFYLHKGYEFLAVFLFENKRAKPDCSRLEKGAIPHKHLPQPLQSVELGLIYLYLGLMSSDDKLLCKGLKCVEFSLSLFDHGGKLFQGLWQNEADYKIAARSETFPLLFQVASQLIPCCSKLRMVSESFPKRCYSDPFIRLFDHGFKEMAFPRLSQGLTLRDVDRSLGFLYYRCGETSLVCSAAGINTGISSIHKRGVDVVSMGPHYAPLADSDYYGIFRLSNGSREGFKDLKIESDDERGKFQGWIRVVSPRGEDRTKDWLFFDLEADKETIDLTIRKSHRNISTPLFYVFFIAADKGSIGNKVELLPGTLNRYRGNADKVLFEKGGSKLEIAPHFEGEMTVIPLAGKDHFWSAHFLVAFSLNKKLYPYRWTIDCNCNPIGKGKMIGGVRCSVSDQLQTIGEFLIISPVSHHLRCAPYEK